MKWVANLKKHSLFWGACLLLICNFLAKVMGFLYRIFMVRIIGTEGIGLTELITPIYSFCLVFASMGIPLAMSRLIASEIGRHRFENIEAIFRLSMRILVIFGIVVTLAAWFLSDWLVSNFVADGRALLCFKAIIPAIFIVTVCSCYRGYFQATKQIGIIGFAQNLEQLTRVVLGLFLAKLLLPYGLQIVIVAISVATVIGESVGLLYVIRQYRKSGILNSAQPTLSTNKIAKYLFMVGTPVTAQRLIMSLILMLQALMIPWLLQGFGLSISEATGDYGSFSGVAMCMIHLPGIFTSTLATAILPSVAEASYNQKLLIDRVNQALQITMIISLPITLLFHRYAEPLCRWLFGASEAGDLLGVLALGAVFIYAQTIITGILQGLGTIRFLLISLIVSGVILLVSLWLLVGRWGIAGAAVANVLFAVINCLLNLGFLIRKEGVRIWWRQVVLKPLAAIAIAWLTAKTAAGLLAAVMVDQYINEYIEFFGFSLILGLVYLAALFWLRGLPRLLIKYFR